MSRQTLTSLRQELFVSRRLLGRQRAAAAAIAADAVAAARRRCGNGRPASKRRRHARHGRETRAAAKRAQPLVALRKHGPAREGGAAAHIVAAADGAAAAAATDDKPRSHGAAAGPMESRLIRYDDERSSVYCTLYRELVYLRGVSREEGTDEEGGVVDGGSVLLIPSNPQLDDECDGKRNTFYKLSRLYMSSVASDRERQCFVLCCDFQ